MAVGQRLTHIVEHDAKGIMSSPLEDPGSQLNQLPLADEGEMDSQSIGGWLGLLHECFWRRLSSILWMQI